MIRIAGVQIAPVFLNAQKTWEKLSNYIQIAKQNGAEIITWGETFVVTALAVKNR